MTKIQLQTVSDTIQGYLNIQNKKDDEMKKKNLEAKKVVISKKTKKKQIMEDHVEDQYDDFDEKYYA